MTTRGDGRSRPGVLSYCPLKHAEQYKIINQLKPKRLNGGWPTTLTRNTREFRPAQSLRRVNLSDVSEMPLIKYVAQDKETSVLFWLLWPDVARTRSLSLSLVFISQALTSQAHIIGQCELAETLITANTWDMCCTQNALSIYLYQLSGTGSSQYL